MCKKSISPKEIEKENLGTIIQEINHYLRFLSKTGCRGFDCSPKALKTLANWEHKRTSLPDTLESIRFDLGNCHRCRLSKDRKNIVFGEGDPHAKLIFVGEAPGFEEDKKGQPFVGAAGQLLTRIIQAIQLTREQVYICNIIKCRPPGNRNPMPDEIVTCLPFLKRQIEIIKPDFICALGSFAAQTLLETRIPITKLRGRFHSYLGIKVLPTYHPAYLLRYSDKKREVWEDMKILMREMHG